MAAPETIGRPCTAATETTGRPKTAAAVTKKRESQGAMPWLSLFAAKDGCGGDTGKRDRGQAMRAFLRAVSWEVERPTFLARKDVTCCWKVSPFLP